MQFDIKNFVKTAGKNFWINLAACVLALVGAIILITSVATRGYAIDGGELVIACSIIAVLAIAGGTVLSLKFGENHFITAIVKLIPIVLMFVAAGIVILGRIDLIGSLFTWDPNNSIGWSIFYLTVVAIVFFAVSAVVLAVNAFLGTKKNKEN